MLLEDDLSELTKPFPQSLVTSITGMNSTSCLYVGDSLEDFIMAKKATILGKKPSLSEKILYVDIESMNFTSTRTFCWIC